MTVALDLVKRVIYEVLSNTELDVSTWSQASRLELAQEIVLALCVSELLADDVVTDGQ